MYYPPHESEASGERREGKTGKRQTPSGLIVAFRWGLLAVSVVFLLAVLALSPGISVFELFDRKGEPWKFRNLREEDGLIPRFDYRYDFTYGPLFDKSDHDARIGKLRIEGKTQLGFNLTSVLRKLRITRAEDVSDPHRLYLLSTLMRDTEEVFDQFARETGAGLDGVAPVGSVLRLIPRGESRPHFTIVTRPGANTANNPVLIYRGDKRKVSGLANFPLYETLALLRARSQ